MSSNNKSSLSDTLRSNTADAQRSALQGGNPLALRSTSLDPLGIFSSPHQVRSSELTAEQTRLAQQGTAFNAAKINNIYDSPERQQQYTDYLNNLRGMYTGQVNDQEDVAARQLKFAEARNGLTGGSAAADSGGMLSRDYQTGLLGADSSAIQGVDALRAADQAQKNQLIALSNAAGGTGIGATDALQGAINSTTANSNASGVQSLGNFFGDVGGAYQNMQRVAATNRGYRQAGLYS